MAESQTSSLSSGVSRSYAARLQAKLQFEEPLVESSNDLTYKPTMLFEHPLKPSNRSLRQHSQASTRSTFTNEADKTSVLEKRLALQQGKHKRLEEHNRELQGRLAHVTDFYSSKVQTLQAQLAELRQQRAASPDRKLEFFLKQLQAIHEQVEDAAEVANQLSSYAGGGKWVSALQI